MDYGMFTKAGGNDVAKIVKVARKDKLTWPQTYKLLENLSRKRNRKEALDTEVRESVYVELNYSTPFYSFQFED